MTRTRWLACLIALALSALGHAQGGYVCWDFETGDLQGWQVVSGNLGPQPSDNDNDRWGGNFAKQGKWFIGTYEGAGDEPQGELRSPLFTIQADKLALLVGGGQYPEETFVALVLADGDTEVCRATGRNAEAMATVIWDVSAFKGQRAYIRVVDRRSGGWGHINVDYVRELSPEELARMEHEQRERREAIERRYQQWRKTVFAPSERIVYRGEHLQACAMPLGGIGAGNLALCGDGALRQWQLSNHVNSAAQVPYSFLGVWARAPGQSPVARVLQTAPVDSLPLIAETEFIGEFPLAQIAYKDHALPVEVSLEAFTPLIPGNAADSGLPAIYFVLQAHNPSTRPAQVAFMISLQNFVGWDGFSTIEGIHNPGFGGNANVAARNGDLVSVYMSKPGMDPNDANFGTLAVSCLQPGASVAVQWDDSRPMWADFAADGTFEESGPPGPSAPGATHNGAVACTMTVGPEETVEAPFILSWHFPNRYAEYDRNLAAHRLGNHYNNRFASAWDVALYAAEHFTRLRHDTRLFRNTFYDTNLPYWIVDCVSATISTLCSQTCMWIEDGTFHAFEGCGCCPMNCTHVWNYEQTLAHLFPELERNMRHTDLFVQQDPSGYVHHRTVLPLHLPRASGPFCDGHLSTISKAYREHRMSADDRWLRTAWPRIRAAMDWAIQAYDPDGNGVIEVEQWNTYDCSVWGPNTFIGSQWLAALRAAEEMAKLMGEPETATRYRQIFEKGSAAMDATLWNGEWYIQDVDLQAHPDYQYGTGCHSDQLLGQWWAHINGLGYVLPREHVRAALQSIFSYNFMKSFEGFVQSPRVFASPDEMGLLICTWPRGGRPAVPTLYSDEVWTGVEYAVAGLMIEEGMIEAAYEIIKAARDRYNGTRRSPWNELECGEHYARAMSSYAILTAIEGYNYDGPAGALKLEPRVQPDNLRAFVGTAEGWGTFQQTRYHRCQHNRIEMAYGRLRLRSLSLRLPPEAQDAHLNLAVKLGAQPWAAELIRDGTAVTLRFPQEALVHAGSVLTAVVWW